MQGPPEGPCAGLAHQRPREVTWLVRRVWRQHWGRAPATPGAETQRRDRAPRSSTSDPET
eukprot:3936320-Rhodomonas_salina.2